MKKEPLEPEDFKLYHNSPEYRYYRRMFRQAQLMMTIVTVLFWLIMAGLTAFCVWLVTIH